MESQVNLAHPRVHLDGFQFKCPKHRDLILRILKAHHHIKKRRPSRIALHLEEFNQMIKRVILMLEGLQDRLTDTSQIRPKRLALRPPPPIGERVDEQPDQVFKIRMDPARDRTTHHHILLPAVFHQKHLKRCQQGHEQTATARRSELLKRTHLVRIDPNVMMGTIEALHRRPRKIQRQSQRFGKAAKNTFPVGLRICASTRSHPVTLPCSEIPVSTSRRLLLRARQSRLHRIQNIKIPHENRK